MANAQLKDMFNKQISFPIFVKYEPKEIYMMDPTKKNIENGTTFVQTGTFQMNEKTKVLEPVVNFQIPKKPAQRKRKRVPTAKVIETSEQEKMKKQQKLLKQKYPVSKKEVDTAVKSITPHIVFERQQEESEEEDEEEYED